MYTNKNLEVIHDNAKYTDSNGTNYPWNFPKDKIDELYPVIETAKPTGENIIVLGYEIVKDGNEYVQQWNTREKTEEEILAPIKGEATTALYASDMVAMRCFKAGVSFPQEWQQYVENLRAVVNGAYHIIPARPEYPEGT